MEILSKLFSTSKTDQKVICWDLDETLGSFRRIGYEIQGKQIPEHAQKLGLKPGIKELLASYANLNYVNIITSSAMRDYVDEVLKRSGLINYFDKTFTREDDISSLHGKSYEPAAKFTKLSRKKALSSMITIGDAPGDAVTDIPGLVHIRLGLNSANIHASTIKSTISALLNAGSNDFNQGFLQIYSQLTPSPEAAESPLPEEFYAKHYQYSPDLSLYLQYNTNHKGYKKENYIFPEVIVAAEDTFREDLEIFE